MRSPGRVWDGAPGRRALREEMPPKAAGASPRHTGFPRIFLVWVGEAQGPPAGNCLNCQEVTLIRPLRGHLPPWRGKAGRAARVCRPYGAIMNHPGRAATWGRSYGERRTESDGSEIQAQLRNRSSGNFCKARAQWPGMKR